MSKCRWCKKLKPTLTVKIIDNSEDKSLSRKILRSFKACRDCLKGNSFFCERHGQARVAVYDNKDDRPNDPTSDFDISGLCLGCVQETLNELSLSECRRYIERLDEKDADIVDSIEKIKDFGLPSENLLERRILFNIIASAYLEEITLETMIAEMCHAADWAASSASLEICAVN